MKLPLSPRIRTAVGSTALAAVFFVVLGDPHKFPGEWFGYIGFLVLVFCVALYGHGKID